MSVHALDVAAHANRRVYIIDDLLGAILLLAAAALAVLLDLTRRQICAVYQLAFALCGASAFFIIGGLVDHHLSNDQLHVALYGSYLSSSLTTSYVYLPTLASLGVSLALLVSLSTCQCDCCCLVGASMASHPLCFRTRIRSNLSLYSTCFFALYVAIGTRLNVRLRESAINPVGGTVHWALLRAPFYLAMAHIGSLLLVALKIFLQHADRTSVANGWTPRDRMVAALPNPTTVEDLMRPPPLKSFALAPPRRTSGDTKHAVPRSPQPTKAVKQPVATRRSAGNNRAPYHDGDVSSLISSDSDSDDSVLRPSFRTTSSSTSSTTGKTLSPRHGATGGVPRKRLSGGSTSGYSSSPPSSPTRSTVSTGSSSSFSASRPRKLNQLRPGSSSSSSSASSARPRLSSSSSTTVLSDHDDHALAHLEAYGSAGTEGSSVTGGIRRRTPSLGTAKAVRRPSSLKLYHETDWLECLDDATGSAYYYNTHTGESRWKDQ